MKLYINQIIRGSRNHMIEKTNPASEEAPRKRGRPRSGQEREDVGASVGSLSRGLLILDVLRQAQGFLALSDIAAEAGLDASTTHRLLQVLTETGYAVRDDAQKRYLFGPRAMAPLSLFHPLSQLRSEAMPLLKMLQDEIGESSALILFLGRERLIVEFTRGNGQLAPYYDTWLRSPLNGSASGKLLLAWMSDSEREAILGPGPYPANTPQTITDPVAMGQELTQVRSQGFAISREDGFQGIVSIGAPLMVQPEASPIGCLTFTALSNSLPPEKEEAALGKLRDAANFLMVSSPALQSFRSWAPRSNSRRL